MHIRRLARLAFAAIIAASVTPAALATSPQAPPASPQAPPTSPQAPPAPQKPPASFILDEYTVTTARTSNSFQLGAGLSFGNSIGPRYWWFAGARVGWVQGERPGDLANAAALGAVGGFGFRPENLISPIARIGFDKWLGGGESYRHQGCVSAGARFRVSPGLVRHYAISFEAYRSVLYGATGVPDRSDFGFLIAYSVAFYQKR